VREVRVPETVYNLSVEGNNNYFAGSILVHNCLHLEAVEREEIHNIAISLPPGCLSGETLIRINRGGKGWSIRIDELVAKFNGQGKYPWDLSIPTMVARAVDGRVRMVKLRRAWKSGVKTTYTVSTAGGRSIRATADHPFMVPDGSYRRVDELSVGDKVAVDIGYKKSPKKRNRYQDTYVRYHPHQRKGNGGFRYWTHRLAMEAKLNGLATDEYIGVLRADPIRSSTFRFLASSEIVHHRDENHKNNSQDNLELFDGNSEHASLHATDLMGCVAWVGEDTVTSIVRHGDEEVYDLEVDGDPHCFLANGFVVHNCTKTKLVMEAFPAWVLGRRPHRRILCISNSEDLATKSSLACRDILKSDWYRKYFPEVQIAADQDTKVFYRTTQGGYRMAKPVGSKIIGQKGDLIIMDDPNDAEQVTSKALADSVKSWYDRGLHDRVNSFVDSCRVAIAQRTSVHDLIGHLVAHWGYEYLFLPEEFDPSRRFTSSVGWTDWRTQPGELLRPERYGPKQVEIGRKALDYQAKHQQNPAAVENAFFKPDWFALRWRHGPTMGSIVLPSADPKEPDYQFDALRCVRFATIDAAASAKTSADHTACTMFVMSPRGDLVVLDCILRQVDIPDQPKVLAELHKKHAPPVLGIERAGANAAMFQYAVRMGFTAVPLEPKSRDKLVRAQPAIIRASQGKLWLPQPGSVPDFDTEDFLAELVAFTGQDGRGRDDRVDTVTLAHELLPYLSQIAIGRAGQPQSVAVQGGAGRVPMGNVPVPPVGGRSGASLPGFTSNPLPSVVRPNSPFGR
jgi:phage terminase large subunit-like protein